MLIGVPKEIKSHEYRAGLVPSGVKELVKQGHQVIVQRDLGTGIGINDADYEAVGATVVPTAKEIFDRTEMIVKVKEPQPNECRMLSEGQILFTFLHLAPDPEQTLLLMESGCTAIAYETVTGPNHTLPLLSPSSEVAGRMSIQAGAYCLEKAQGGSGVLLGGVPGVAPANVVVIGGGVVGLNALRIAIGMEANVTVIDSSVERLRVLNHQFGAKLHTIYSTADAIEYYALTADLIVGAVLIPGAAAPKLITKDMLKQMRERSVLVDVSIDQGGCFETSKPTTHQEPTYIIDEVIHYCVANMPGAVARTSTFGLTNATLPYVKWLANHALSELTNYPDLLNGLNIHRGEITYEAVAHTFNKPYRPAAEVLLK